MGLPVPLRRPGDTTRHCQDLLSPGEAPPPELVDRDSLRVLNPCRLPVHDSIFVVLRQRVEGGERGKRLESTGTLEERAVRVCFYCISSHT